MSMRDAESSYVLDIVIASRGLYSGSQSVEKEAIAGGPRW